MNWLESILYGLISGASDILPISSQAHQDILLKLFGQTGHDYVRDLFVHIALLLSVYTGCRSIIDQLRREQVLRQRNRRTLRGSAGLLEVRLLKNAALPLVLGMLILSYVTGGQLNLVWTAVLLLINGIWLFAPQRMMQGNKDERSMTGLDSLLVGVFGALSALSGISRTGAMLSFLASRGVKQHKAMNWALLLSISALLLLIGLDILKLFSASGAVSFWGSFGGYILSAAGAYLGGSIAIALMKFLSQRSGFSAFAFYCWGAALFTFILYLIVV